MNRLLFCGFLLSLCTIPTLLYSQNLNATNELQLGIAAYDKARYDEAIETWNVSLRLIRSREKGISI